MKSIHFNQEITFEQYQMAVRVLEAIGLEVQKNEMPTLPLEDNMGAKSRKSLSFNLRFLD